MNIKRKPYFINLDPTLIKALDVHIIKEKKRVFNGEGHYGYAIRCWSRWAFIERAIKDFNCADFNNAETPKVTRRPYTIRLDPNLVAALDLIILEEKKRVFEEMGNYAYVMLKDWHRNLFIERAIKQLIEG